MVLGRSLKWSRYLNHNFEKISLLSFCDLNSTTQLHTFPSILLYSFVLLLWNYTPTVIFPGLPSKDIGLVFKFLKTLSSCNELHKHLYHFQDQNFPEAFHKETHWLLAPYTWTPSEMPFFRLLIPVISTFKHGPEHTSALLFNNWLDRCV